MASSTLSSEVPAQSASASDDIYVNIAEVPDALLSLDAPTQRQALLYISGSEDDNELKEEAERFSKHGPRSIPLADMQKNYEEKRSAMGLGLLAQRVKINWRDSNKVSFPKEEGSKVNWRVTKHFLDMLVAVSNGIGLGALLPNTQVACDTNWEFVLDLSKNQTRDFGIMHAKLGFNPLQRMLWVGKTSMSEDVWIAMVPNTFETDHSLVLDELKDAGKRSTHLRERHRKALLVFLAYVLQRAGMRHIYLSEEYPDLDDDEALKLASNIL
jgi:hypothetical protein